MFLCALCWQESIVSNHDELDEFFNKKDKLFDKKIRCDCYGYLWGEEARSTGNKEDCNTDIVLVSIQSTGRADYRFWLCNWPGRANYKSVIGPGGPITNLLLARVSIIGPGCSSWPCLILYIEEMPTWSYLVLLHSGGILLTRNRIRARAIWD